MAHTHPLVRLANLSMLIGGLVLLFSTDFAIFPYALLLCVIGIILTIWQTDRYTDTWSTRIGALSLLGALLCTLAGILGQAIPLVVFTSKRYGEAGNVLDVINYPLSYFTDRYGSISAFLMIGVGLFFLISSVRTTDGWSWWKRVLSIVAILSIVLYFAGVVDVYLDGETPGILGKCAMARICHRLDRLGIDGDQTSKTTSNTITRRTTVTNIRQATKRAYSVVATNRRTLWANKSMHPTRVDRGVFGTS